MNETVMKEPIDVAIGQVERLYRSLTGREAPAIGEAPETAIPPEMAPEEHLGAQVDRLLESLSRFSVRGAEPNWLPPCTVWEGEQDTRIFLDLPGVARESLKVRVLSRGWLEITGERALGTTEAEKGYRLSYAEPPQGPFRRMIPLPQGTSAEELQAQLREGVLEVRIPRAESSQGQTIPVV